MLYIFVACRIQILNLLTTTVSRMTTAIPRIDIDCSRTFRRYLQHTPSLSPPNLFKVFQNSFFVGTRFMHLFLSYCFIVYYPILLTFFLSWCILSVVLNLVLLIPTCLPQATTPVRLLLTAEGHYSTYLFIVFVVIETPGTSGPRSPSFCESPSFYEGA